MENTYLDPEAMVKRINQMKEQANRIFSEIKKSGYVMDDLKKNFEGTSADRLQHKYNELADTFDDFLAFLNQKAQMMEALTANIRKADEQ